MSSQCVITPTFTSGEKKEAVEEDHCVGRWVGWLVAFDGSEEKGETGTIVRVFLLFFSLSLPLFLSPLTTFSSSIAFSFDYLHRRLLSRSPTEIERRERRRRSKSLGEYHSKLDFVLTHSSIDRCQKQSVDSDRSPWKGGRREKRESERAKVLFDLSDLCFRLSFHVGSSFFQLIANRWTNTLIHHRMDH